MRNRIGEFFYPPQPYVACVRAIDDESGRDIIVPIGIILARSQEDAWDQALDCWPHYVVLIPAPWHAVPPPVRKEAIRNDSLETYVFL